MSKPKTVAKVQPRKSLTMVAYEQLEELITTLKLEPGTVLSEAALVDQLGIGRTPIREALQKLEREGLIENPSDLRIRQLITRAIADVPGVTRHEDAI